MAKVYQDARAHFIELHSGFEDKLSRSSHEILLLFNQELLDTFQTSLLLLRGFQVLKTFLKNAREFLLLMWLVAYLVGELGK